MMLSSGSTYIPGEGRERAMHLRDGNLEDDILAMYVAEARDSIARYGYVPGAPLDLFVADLIDRGIIRYREVALALLEGQAVR